LRGVQDLQSQKHGRLALRWREAIGFDFSEQLKGSRMTNFTKSMDVQRYCGLHP
jgi:hypothetical protein